MHKFFIYILVFIICTTHAEDHLSADEAFKVSLTQTSKTNINVHFHLAPGYDIYKDKLHINTTDDSSAKISVPVLPAAIMEHNKILGDYEVYKNNVDIDIPITSFGNNKLALDISYEGCKGLEYCFPAMEQILPLTLNPNLISTIKKVDDEHQITISDFVSSGNSLQISNIFSRNIYIVFLCFFLVGILIAFTPCVFPMLPILLTIISGKNTSTKKSVTLASFYILGSSSSYAIAGVMAAKFGNVLQSVLQSTYVNMCIIGLFVLFSLSLFGLLTIQLPNSLTSKLYGVSQNRVSVISTFIAGGVSALVLSPCVTAPLAGALLYISYTGNLVIGGGSLFFMGIGMGLPLLLIAVFGNKFLPKSGKWMETVKYCFAYLMLFMAIYISSRLLNTDWIKILCGGLLLIISFHLIIVTVKQNINSKKLSIIIMLVTFIGAAYLVTTASKSLYSNNMLGKKNPLQFQVVDNKQDLEKILSTANKNKPIILDFTAGWCLACKEMELTTFSDKRIIDSLTKYTRIRVDVTSNSQEAQKLEKAYGVFAPPSLVFIGQNGKVDNKSMVTGYINADKLHKILQYVK